MRLLLFTMVSGDGCLHSGQSIWGAFVSGLGTRRGDIQTGLLGAVTSCSGNMPLLIILMR
jgi:hypothetical protein